MKKLLPILAILSLMLSCEKALKDVNDYFPEVSTVNASVQADGTVLVEGEILSEGAAAVEYLGFCVSTSPDPQLLDRQQFADFFDGERFTTIYSGGFDPDATYYFRAWATNEYGYVTGETVSLSGIIGSNISAPCQLSSSSCSIGGGQPTSNYYTVSLPVEGFNYWEITAQTLDGPTVTLKFGSSLTTAVYTTVGHNSPEPGQVFVSFYSGFIQDSLEEGSSVYVNRLSPGIFEIIICDAPWIHGGGSAYYFNTRLKSPT